MNSYQHCICCLDCSLYVASAIEISRSWKKQDCLKLSHRIMAGVQAEEYNPIHPAGMAWVGCMVTILLKIVPPKQLPAAIPDALAERMAGTQQL